MTDDVTFYFDLGSPYAYLASERLATVISQPVTWQPVLLGGLFKLTGRSSWALGDYQRRQAGMAEIERRARGYGLPLIRWPDPWPSDYLAAMRATTYAFAAGAGAGAEVAAGAGSGPGAGSGAGAGSKFAHEAFRAAFQRGQELSIVAHVLGVATRAGLDAGAVERAIADPEIKGTLRNATDAAYERGVFGVPTLAVGDELFWGDDRLEDAAAYLGTHARNVTQR
jgi:2-hydroxychromene-2-carboxylate isomerase